MHALAAFSEPAARIAVATLFNSLWEGALLAVAVWALLNYLPNINATTRYAAWCVALIAALVVPIVTAIPQVSVQNTSAYHHAFAPPPAISHNAATAATAKLPANLVTKAGPVVSVPQPRALAPSFPSRLRFALPQALALGIFAAWIAASLFLLMRLTFNLFKLEALKRDALPLSLDYREQLARWARAEKGGRDIRLCVSEHIEVPVAVGLFDSMVLIPKHLLETLSEKEIDQITLHELAHLRRADDWTNGIQRVIQAIFFFNPAVLFMAQQLDLEREVACDDWVLHQTGDVRPYATCLTRMAEVTAWPHRALAAPGVFMTRRGLSVRVERLLRAGRNVRTSVSFGPAGAVAAALIVMFFVAQNVAPSFAFTLASGPHVTVAHVPAAHTASALSAAGKSANTPVKTTVVYRDKYLPAPQTALESAIVAGATPAPRATSTITKKKTTVVKRTTIRSTTIHNGMVDVQVPAVNVHVPEVNVNIPAMRYKVPYGYKAAGLKRVADLNGSCTGCDFSRVQWAGRNLSRVALVGSDFSNADLHGANFSYANLTGVDFSGANLRDVNFASANMEGCDMRHADLTGANFTGAHINGCDIEISKLAPAQARAILAGCQGCDFRGANLRGQDLRGLSVSGDDFSSADLRGADMRNASFNGIDFKNARLDGAHLEGASFNGCDFTGVDLRNVDLSHTQITGSKINIMR